MLNIELVLLDKLGFDLAKNSYAFNETIGYISRLIVPFALLIIISILTRPDDKKRLDRFYVKMKTTVIPNREADDKEMAISYENPHRFDHLKMFPNSNWEFCKYDKTDIKGMLWTLAGCAGLVLFLYVVVNMGG